MFKDRPLPNFVYRVIKWNELRYDQVYDYNLAKRLLLEETEELYRANSVVEKLDAIGDIIFVAVGVFWKLGVHHEVIIDFFYGQDVRKLTLDQLHEQANTINLFCCEALDDTLEYSYPGFSLATYSTFITAIGTLKGLGLEDLLYEVMDAICTSNETKSIGKKVDTTIKANTVKGLDYVPPTTDLLTIYTNYINTRKVH